jgi:uncharacterized protein YgiB involved in biofilm formation
VKRSTQIGLSAVGLLMVAGAMSGMKETDDAVVYDSVDDCRAAGEMPAAQCEQRFAEARAAYIASAPKFGSTAECEASYGPGRCETRGPLGAAYVVPAFAGLVLARSLLGGGGQAQPLLPPTRQACPPGDPREQCQPRSSSSGGGVGGSGGGRSSSSSGTRSYTTTSGEAVTASAGRTSASVVSRGGFGGTGHGFGSSAS